VSVADGSKVSVSGKVGKATTASFKDSGEKFSQDSTGSYEAAVFLKEIIKTEFMKFNKPAASTGKAIVEVGEASLPECLATNQTGGCQAK
jgi:hypothetical protein